MSEADHIPLAVDPPSEQARRWWCYVLVDPRKIDDEWGGARYVGKSIDTKARMATHLSEAKEGGRQRKKDNWIRKLVRLGMRPSMVQIEMGAGYSEDEIKAASSAAEKRWIAGFRALGCPLKNLTDGGEGTIGYVHSAESRAKNSAARRGKKQSPERAAASAAHLKLPEVQAKMNAARRGSKKSEAWKQKNRKKRLGKALERIRAGAARRKARGWKPPPASAETRAKISAAGMGRKMSAESIAKTAAANVGRIHSAQARANMSAAHIGKKNSPEAIAKAAAANTGRKRSDETRARMSAARTGMQFTDEHRSNIAAARKGKLLSDETKAKISKRVSESLKKWWAQRKAAGKTPAAQLNLF